MKRLIILLLSFSLILSLGCSRMTTLESAGLTKLDSRVDYIQNHPDCLFASNIQNGEVKAGMNAHEVIASWGFPNVYMFSGEHPQEYWVYYVEDDDTKAMMTYTLTFTDEFLESWDIDMKRYMDHRIVYDDSSRRDKLSRTGTVPAKR